MKTAGDLLCVNAVRILLFIAGALVEASGVMSLLCSKDTFKHNLRNGGQICIICPRNTYIPFHYHNKTECYPCSMLCYGFNCGNESLLNLIHDYTVKDGRCEHVWPCPGAPIYCPKIVTSTINMTSNTTTSLASNPTTSLASALSTRSTTSLTSNPSSNSVTDSNTQLQTSMTPHTTQPDTPNSSSINPSTDNKGNTETDNNDLPAIVGSVCGLIALVFIIIICCFLWRRRRFQTDKSSEVHDGLVMSVSPSDSAPSNPDPYYNTLHISGTPNGTGIVNFTENNNRISEVLDSGNRSTEQACNSFPYKNTSNQLDDHYIEPIDPSERDNLSNYYDYINDDEVAGTIM